MTYYVECDSEERARTRTEMESDRATASRDRRSDPAIADAAGVILRLSGLRSRLSV